MTKNDESILEKVGAKVRNLHADAEIYLYGSRARGTAHEESDWDFLILLNRHSVSRKVEQEIRHLLLDLELETGEDFSIFVFSKREWEEKYWVTPFYMNIKEEGKRIV